MLRLIGLCVSIGLADSVNPSTIGPALYMAGGEHARQRVLQFTIGVFLVYFVGGAAIAIGPGQLLLSLVPRPDHEDRAVLEIVAGGAMMIASFFLWRHRDRLASREPRAINPQARSSALLGVTITAIELPTAFPYFAAIAAKYGNAVGSSIAVIVTPSSALERACGLIALGSRLAKRSRWRQRKNEAIIIAPPATISSTALSS